MGLHLPISTTYKNQAPNLGKYDLHSALIGILYVCEILVKHLALRSEMVLSKQHWRGEGGSRPLPNVTKDLHYSVV